MSVKWAKSVPSFLSLPLTDQTLLLEESWAQLFLLNISQWSIEIDEGSNNFRLKTSRYIQYKNSQFYLVTLSEIFSFTNAVALVQENIAMTGSSVSPSSLSTEARHIKDVITKLNGFKLDHTEYTCLKALALFKPGIFDISSNNSFNRLYLKYCS